MSKSFDATPPRGGLTEAAKAVHWFERARYYRAEVERLGDALERIRDCCGDDSGPEDNAVEIAREALEGQ